MLHNPVSFNPPKSSVCRQKSIAQIRLLNEMCNLIVRMRNRANLLIHQESVRVSINCFFNQVKKLTVVKKITFEAKGENQALGAIMAD